MKRIGLITSTLLLASTTMANPSVKGVLVIDQGIDFNHPELSSYQNRNLLEDQGLAKSDDDANGFVDDTLGWNGISDDAEYMPLHILKDFEQNKEIYKKIFALYSRVEDGDPEAIEIIQGNELILGILNRVLGQSHGMHVAGIVSQSSLLSAQMQSYNLFEASSQSRASVTGESPVLAANFSFGGGFQALSNRLLAEAHNALSEEEEEFISLFDQPELIKLILKDSDIEGQQNGKRVDAYVKASSANVVNLSLGASYLQLFRALNEVWRRELAEANLPADTEMTQDQTKNFKDLLKGLLVSRVKMWDIVFGNNEDTLFVVAAGNDGMDNDTYPVFPANHSVRFDNVITVAATNDEGVLTDFSNYSSEEKSVNIAAPGKAIHSLALGDMHVKMSGTSMSAPNVAGVAARVRQINPLLTAVEIRELLENTGLPAESLKGKISSGKVLNPEAAFHAAHSGSLDPGILVLGARDFFGNHARSAPSSLFSDFAGTAFGGHLGETSKTPDLVKSILFR